MTAVDCVLDAKAGIGEGAVWSQTEQALWWVEILERRLHRFDPATGRNISFEMPSFVGCVGLRQNGGLIVALQEGFAFFDPVTKLLEILPGCAPGRLARRFNDGAVSPDGRFLATTMMAAPPFDRPDQELMAMNGEGVISRVANGLRIGNGLAFSNEGRTLYLSDSHPAANVVWAFDWDPDDGVATNRRTFFDATSLPGHPDGAAVDSEGCYWYAASYGWSIVRLTPDGKVDRTIPVPVQKPTKVAFGGPRLDTLYLTSIGSNLEPGSELRQPNAGGLFALHPGVRGMPASLFAG